MTVYKSETLIINNMIIQEMDDTEIQLSVSYNDIKDRIHSSCGVTIHKDSGLMIIEGNTDLDYFPELRNWLVDLFKIKDYQNKLESIQNDIQKINEKLVCIKVFGNTVSSKQTKEENTIRDAVIYHLVNYNSDEALKTFKSLIRRKKG